MEVNTVPGTSWGGGEGQLEQAAEAAPLSPVWSKFERSLLKGWDSALLPGFYRDQDAQGSTRRGAGGGAELKLLFLQWGPIPE